MAKKTYYSVVYRNWGADRPGEAWFDNKRQNEQRLKQAAQKNNLDGSQFFTRKFNGTVGNLK